MSTPYTCPVDVLLLLVDRGRVLLALRENTGYADGWWNLPSGKLEAGEDAAAAMVRETGEEIGLTLTRGQLELAATVHYANAAGQGRLGLFFTAGSWTGRPVNAEPHKCAGIDWFDLEALPANTYPYSRIGVDCYRTGRRFAVHGWPEVNR